METLTAEMAALIEEYADEKSGYLEFGGNFPGSFAKWLERRQAKAKAEAQQRLIVDLEHELNEALRRAKEANVIVAFSFEGMTEFCSNPNYAIVYAI